MRFPIEVLSMITPLLSFVAYSGLLVIVLRRRLQMVHKTFAVFLASLALWGFLCFLTYSNLFVEQTPLLYEFITVTVILIGASYYHFLRAFMGRPGGIGAKLGYGIALASIPLAFTGNLVKDAYVSGGLLYLDLQPAIYGLAVAIIVLLGSAVFSLARQHRRLKDPLARSRVAYILVGFVIAFLFLITNFVPPLSRYPLANLGNIINALIITYSIQKHQLLDIRLVTRRGVVFTVFAAAAVAIFVGLATSLGMYAPVLPVYSVILATALTALVVALFFRPASRKAQELVDRRVFGQSYDYRQFLLSYSNQMSNTLDIDELAEKTLSAITNALHTREASLLLPETESGDFVTRFVHGREGHELTGALMLRKDNPILAWLAKHGRALNVDSLDTIPELKGLWKDERSHLVDSQVEIMLPIRSRARLVGVLALTEKKSGSPYYTEDISLLSTMANEAGIVMENAQLYADAITRAHTDGLTGLFNHRYFHERLDEEISRSSRFGTALSVIMMDLDLFKPYNDIYGHVAGDEVLRQVGQSIKRSVRGIDIPCRYGGEEFAIILPETRLDDAHTVAERIRRGIELEMFTKQIPLTASLGVASWPADGVTKEELVRCADAAMYLAKAIGRNRTCLSTEVIPSHLPTMMSDQKPSQEALGMVYALAAAVDAKDHYTYGHSKKVAQNAVALAEALDLPPAKIATIRAAAMLHDVGKIGIPDETLNKPDRLSDDEWKLLRTHPQMGAQIIRHVPDLSHCVPGIQHHHERWDGAGYPSGLKGENIPLDARIMAIADTYAAMTSVRPYRKAMSPSDAIEELKRSAGTQLDPKLTELFVSITELARQYEVETPQGSQASRAVR